MQQNQQLHTGVGKNQTLTRDVNLSLIMRAFMRQSMSKADISRIFHLSKPTSSKIIAELERLDFICLDPDFELAQSTPGAKPLKYRLNRQFGHIAMIDMSTVETRIQLCDFGGAVLREAVVPNMELIRFSDIERFCDLLDEMLRSEAGPELVAICVAIPSAVNKRTGKIDWSSRFEIASDFDFFAYLRKRYPQSEILLENDVQLMLSGEIYTGLLASECRRYALLVYVDAGLGGSFYFDGRLENGEEGKAGDLGFLPYLDRNGEYVYLDSVISINAIKKNLHRELEKGAYSSLSGENKLTFSAIKSAYFGGDPLVVKIIESTALETAKAIESLLEILNINFVILTGRITQFGERYRTLIEDSLKRRFPSVCVSYSVIQDSAIHDGAMFVVSNTIISRVISNRKAQ